MNLRFLPFAAFLLAPAVVCAMPRGTVVLNNGTTLEDVEYEVRGKSVRVTLKYGARTYPMSDIRRLVPKDGDGGGPDSEGGEDEETASADWETRFQLAEPEGWEAVQPSSPLTRARLQHSEHDAFLEVTVRPAESPWDISEPGGRNARVPRDVSEEIATDLGRQFAAQPRPVIAPMAYKGSRVYRVGAFAVTPYRAKKGDFRLVTELRFRRHGLEYAVTYSVKKEDAPSLKHEEGKALAAFSFLPALALDAEHFADYEHGLSIRRPNEDWTVNATPFSTDRPVILKTADGRGEVDVRVEPGRPENVVAEIFKQREKASRHFEKKREEPSKHRGSEVIAFEFEDFKRGGRKKLHYQGFAAFVQGRTLVVTGMAPLSDEDAKKIDREVSAILASVQLYDAEQVRKQLGSEKDALSSLSRGYAATAKKRHSEALQQFDEAIRAMPNYALAYYLRGQANKALGNIKEYAADVEKAAELAPESGFEDELGNLARTEAVGATKRRDWERALELWRRVYSSSRDAKDLKELTTAGSNLWSSHKKKGNIRDGVRDIDKTLKSERKTTAVHTFLAQVYREGCAELIKKKDYSDARRMVLYMRKLGKAVRQKKYEDEAKRLDANIKRARGR